MAGPGDPQDPSTPAPPPSSMSTWWRRYQNQAPVPWWRWVADRTPGLGPVADAAEAAGTWINETASPWFNKQLGLDPQTSRRPAPTMAELDRRIAAIPGQRPAAPATPATPPLAPDAATEALYGSLGDNWAALKDEGKRLFTPDKAVTFLADQARARIAEHGKALGEAFPEVNVTPLARGAAAALPQNELGEAARIAAGALPDRLDPLAAAVQLPQTTIPNFTVGALEDTTTPGGMLLNTLDPSHLGLLAKGALAAKGGVGLGAIPGLTSRVDRLLSQVGKGGVAPGRLYKILRTDAGLVDEATHRRLDELIARGGGPATTQRTISQAELQAHLQANPAPDVSPIVLGEENMAPYERYIEAMQDKYGPDFDPDAILPEERARLQDLWNMGRAPSAKYPTDDLNIGGGDNYRETLLQLQGQPHNPYEAFIRQMEAKYGEGYNTTALTPEERTTQAMLWDRSQRTAGGMTESQFTGGHYPQPNILAHIRHDERRLAPGRQVDPRVRDAFSLVPPERRPAFLQSGLRPFEEIEQIIQQAVGAKSTGSIASGAPEVAVRKGLITSEEAALYGNTKGFTNYPHPPGARGRFLQEIQTDWISAGEKHGFRARPTPEQRARLAELTEARAATRQLIDANEATQLERRRAFEAQRTAELRARLPPEYQYLTNFEHALQAQGRGNAGAMEAWRTARSQIHRESTPALEALRDAEMAADEQLRIAIERMRELDAEYDRLRAPSGVPDAPFKDDRWTDLALKQQLLDVAHNPDLSWLGFTSGQTQNARYNLQTRVSRIEYNPDSRELHAYDLNGDQILYEVTDLDGLEEFIGKDPAARLTDQVRLHHQEQAYERSQWSTEIDPDSKEFLILDPNGEVVHDMGGSPELYPTKALADSRIDGLLDESRSYGRTNPAIEGMDLTLGGEGMEHYYDQVVPSRLEKLLRPHGGGSVDYVELPTGPPRWADPAEVRQSVYGDQQWYLVDRETGEWGAVGYPSREAAQAALPASVPAPTEPSWVARLSEETKASIREKGFDLLSILPPALVGAGAATALYGEDAGEGGSSGLGMAALGFVPGMRRPGLTKAGRALIEEARQHLTQVGLTGPVTREILETILREAPIAHAHKVTKDLPVEAPLGEARRILLPGEEGFDFSPPAQARLHGMADIGAALPFQANWGNALDPAMAPAFNYDRRGAERFGRFFAALSPRTSVPKNALEAINVWYDYLRNPGKPFTDQRLRDLGVGNVRSKTDNITRAILGDDPSGEKVDLFTDYMAGRAILPVPDVHGLYAMGSKHKSIDSVLPELKRLVERHEGIPRLGGGLTDKDYTRRLVDAFGRSLQAYDPEQPMGRLFGSTWEGTRAQKGLSPQGGMIDIYGSRGLTEPGAMFDLKVLSNAIRDWSAAIRR